MSSKFVYNGLITAGINIIISLSLRDPLARLHSTNQQLFHLNKTEFASKKVMTRYAFISKSINMTFIFVNNNNIIFPLNNKIFKILGLSEHYQLSLIVFKCLVKSMNKNPTSTLIKNSIYIFVENDENIKSNYTKTWQI